MEIKQFIDKNLAHYSNAILGNGDVAFDLSESVKQFQK
jgi:hypothetical protein